ncbi:EDD domain-containing protein, DegV family [Clostridium aceticum]|uniref:EDD domain-containing protein, DegV family n=1 Tax=Clostridium aceticum TaxID=84022 RepID=A0A0D8IC41_9CLOT|nr:DegV family protein [Clostridium aceticum]AKL94911.1 EDD domain-containing protein, DegV family [Clostridium aceticum]KJF27833.1 fatty acid-binding protein DegV [Clostridium aceticum]
MKIITDSSCDLPQELLKEHGILVVPLGIEIDGNDYIDCIDLSHHDFYKKMAASNNIPKTSQPSPQRFIDAFKEGLQKYGEVLSIHLSSKLSGTYSTAMMAKDMVNEKIEVFDSLSGSLGLGLQVLKASQLAKEGFSVEKIMEKLKEYREEMKVIVYLETLENAVKGGRVTKTKEIVANLLNLKPIVHVEEGYVRILKTVRGKKKAMRTMLDMMEEKNISFKDRIIGITHCDCLEEALKLKEEIIEKFNPAEVMVTTMGPVIGSHSGLGGLLVCF